MTQSKLYCLSIRSILAEYIVIDAPLCRYHLFFELTNRYHTNEVHLLVFPSLIRQFLVQKGIKQSYPSLDRYIFQAIDVHHC